MLCVGGGVSSHHATLSQVTSAFASPAKGTEHRLAAILLLFFQLYWSIIDKKLCICRVYSFLFWYTSTLWNNHHDHANWHIHHQLPLARVRMVRTLKISHPSGRSWDYHRIAVYEISRTHSSCMRKPCTLWPASQPPTPGPGTHHSALRFCEFD